MSAETHSVQFTNADNNVDFDVHAFNSNTELNETFTFSDVFYQKGFEDSQSDAKAEIEHVIDDFQGMFKLNVPYMGLNSPNLDGANIRYYISPNSWPTIPFSQAVVQTNQINPNAVDQTIGKDVLRYMVEKISGGTNMLGLFKNQKNILDELNSIANNNINSNIYNSLNTISDVILTDSDYVADANSPTYYVSSVDNQTIAYNPLRILSSTILGDGDLNNDGFSDLNNNKRREILISSLLNQINAHNSEMQSKEFHAVTSGSDESTGNTDVQYRVFLTEAAFDAAYPEGSPAYSQKQVIDGSTFNARLAGVDFWGFRVSAVTASNQALNNDQISLLENLVNKKYDFSFQDGDSLNLIVEYNPRDSSIGFVAGQGVGGIDTISQITTNIPVRKYEIKITLKLAPDTSVLKINDPLDAVSKNVVDFGSNNYLVNQFNEIVAPGNVTTGLNNIFSLIVARMIDGGNAETFSGNLKDFSASDYSNANDVVKDLYVLDSDGQYYPVKIGYINNSVDKYFAVVYSKQENIVVLHAVHSDGTNPDFPTFSPGNNGDYQVTEYEDMTTTPPSKPVWSMFNKLENTPSTSLGGSVIRLNGSIYQIAGHDLFVLKDGAFLPHEVRTQYKTSNNNTVVLNGGETLFMNKNGSYEKFNTSTNSYEYINVLDNSHRNSLYNAFSVGQSAVQLNVNNSTISVYMDYDGNLSAVQKNSGMVFAKKTGEVKLLHVCSSNNNTINMTTLLREEDVVSITENVDFKIAGNVLKNSSGTVILPLSMQKVTASMIIPESQSAEFIGTGLDSAGSHILNVDTNNQLVSRNGFVKANNINNLLSLSVIDTLNSTSTYTNGSSSLSLTAKQFALEYAEDASMNVFLHPTESSVNKTLIADGTQAFSIGLYSSQLKLSLNDVNVHTIVNKSNNSFENVPVHTVVLNSVPSSIITNTINLVAVGLIVNSSFKVFNAPNNFVYNSGIGSLIGLDSNRFDSAGKLLAVNAGIYANMYVLNTGSIENSLFVSNSSSADYLLLSHNRTTLTTQSNLNNILSTNSQLITNTFVDPFTEAYVNGNQVKVNGNTNVDANSTVYRPFQNHIYSHTLYTYTSTSSIFIDIHPGTNVSSHVDGYDYLWVTWSNGASERMNKADSSGLRVKILVEPYHDSEVNIAVNSDITVNANLYVEIGGSAKQLYIPNVDGEAYTELTSGDVYYLNGSVYSKLVDNNHESRYHAYPASNEYSKLIGKTGTYWELRDSSNVRYDMGEPLSTALRIPGDLSKSLSTNNLGTLYAYVTSPNFVKSFGNGQTSNETENETLEINANLFYETAPGSGVWNTLSGARTSMLSMVSLTDGDYNTLNAKTSVGTGFLHKNLDNGKFQAAVNGVDLDDVLLDGASPYNEIAGKIYFNSTRIGADGPYRLGNNLGPILVESNHDPVNLYIQDGTNFSKISSNTNVDVPVVDLNNLSIDVIAEKYRNGQRLYTHGEMNLQITNGANSTVVVDANNLPVTLTNDQNDKGAWIEFYLSNSPNTPLLVDNKEAYFINPNLTQEQTDKTLYSRNVNGSYYAYTQINTTVREHNVAEYRDDTASEIGVNLVLGKVFALHGGELITTVKDDLTSYAYVRYSGHASGDVNALFENPVFTIENSRLNQSSNQQLYATIAGDQVVTLIGARGNINGVSPNNNIHFTFDNGVYKQMEITFDELVDHAAGTVTFRGRELGGGFVNYIGADGNPILHDANTMKYFKSGDDFVHTEIGEQLFLNNEDNNDVYKLHNGNYTKVSLGGHDSSLLSPSSLSNMFDLFIPELNKSGKAIYDAVSGTRKHLIKVPLNGDATQFSSNISERSEQNNYVDVVAGNGDRLYSELEYTNADLITLFGATDMSGNDASGKVFLCTPLTASYLNDNASDILVVDLSSNVNHASVSKIKVLTAKNYKLDSTTDTYLAIETNTSNIYRVINYDEIQHTVISTASSNPRKEFAFFNLDTQPRFTINITDSEGSSSSSTGRTLTFLVGADAGSAVPLIADPIA